MCEKRPLARLWSGIEAGSKAASIPILIVASFSLYYSCQNYGIQYHADRPLVRTTGAQFVRTGDTIYTLRVSFKNVGKKDAIRVRPFKAGTLNSTTIATNLLGLKLYKDLDRHYGQHLGESIIQRNSQRQIVRFSCYLHCVWGEPGDFEPDITFFDVHHFNNDLQIESPTASEQKSLSSRFSCAKLER